MDAAQSLRRQELRPKQKRSGVGRRLGLVGDLFRREVRRGHVEAAKIGRYCPEVSLHPGVQGLYRVETRAGCSQTTSLIMGQPPQEGATSGNSPSRILHCKKSLELSSTTAL